MQFNAAKKEARILKQLKHENIINLIETFENMQELKIIIILEYCEYGSLHHQIKERKFDNE